jgi:shikimate kinase
MMGAGKSSLGRALAELSGREFVDTDLILQNKLGRPVSQIFQIYGEEAFRDHESSILRNLEPGEFVVSTGGGSVIRSENWSEFRRLGTTIFLNAKFETLVSRLTLSKKKRPLLLGENWEDRARELLDSRLDLYKQADLTIHVDDMNLEIGAQALMDAIQNYEQFANRP